MNHGSDVLVDELFGGCEAGDADQSIMPSAKKKPKVSDPHSAFEQRIDSLECSGMADSVGLVVSTAEVAIQPPPRKRKANAGGKACGQKVV